MFIHRTLTKPTNLQIFEDH